jgi:hemolysin activation/secretion protein
MGLRCTFAVHYRLRAATAGMLILLPAVAGAQAVENGANANRFSEVRADPVSLPEAGQRAPDTFPVYAIDVTGVTKLSAGEIERIVYSHTGPAKNNADVEAARAAIQDAYVAKGYQAVIVTLPNQDTETFNRGVITIAVSEAPVGEVRFANGKYHAGEAVRHLLPSAKAGEPLNLKQLQAELDAANRYPDRQVSPVFVPGTTPGTLDVEFNVDSKFPLHATLELNNDNSPSTSRLRASGTVKYTNLWNAGHTASVSFVVAPENQRDSSVVSGSYSAPILESPWTLLLYGYKSNSNIAALGGSNVLGNGYQIGTRAIYRLPTTGTSQSISLGADFKDFKQDILIASVNAASTPIRYVPLVAEYNIFARDDSSPFANKIGVSDFSANIGTTLGLRSIKRDVCAVIVVGQPCTPVDQFRNREIDSFENFVHVNAGFSYSLTTKSDFVFASNWTLQIADSHLVTNEQFAAGGQSSVRGYFQSEAVGDDGFVSNFELQAPSMARLLGGRWLNELRVFGFVDSAFVSLQRTLPGQIREFRLLGVGGGARIKLFEKLFGELTLAYPLNAGSESIKNDPRAVFVVRGEF